MYRILKFLKKSWLYRIKPRMARQEQSGFIVGSIPSSRETVKLQILRLEEPWSLAGALGKYLKGTNLKYVVYFFI